MIKKISISAILFLLTSFFVFSALALPVYAQTDESVQGDAQANRNPLTGGGESDAVKELEGEGWLRKVPFVGNWMVDKILGESIRAEISDETKDLRSETGQEEWTYDSPLKRGLCRLNAIPCRPAKISPPLPKSGSVLESGPKTEGISPEELQEASRRASDLKKDLERIDAEKAARENWQAQQWYGCRAFGFNCPEYVPPKPEGTFDVAKAPLDDIETPDDLRDALSDSGGKQFTKEQQEFLEGFRKAGEGPDLGGAYQKFKKSVGDLWGDFFGPELTDAEKEAIRLKADQEFLAKYPREDLSEDIEVSDGKKPFDAATKVIIEYVSECQKNPSRPECAQLKPPTPPPTDEGPDLEDDELTEEDFLPPPPDEKFEDAPPPVDYGDDNPYDITSGGGFSGGCYEQLKFDTCYNSCGDVLSKCASGALTCNQAYETCKKSCGPRPVCQ